jgi:predicted transcriptional regulator
MITLKKQTENKLQEIADQTSQTVQQLIESFILDYQDEQESIKRADQSYAEHLSSGVSFSLDQIKQDNDLAN